MGAAGRDRNALCNGADLFTVRFREQDRNAILSALWGKDGAMIHTYEYQGRPWTKAEISKTFGLNMRVLTYRLDEMGMTVEKAVALPAGYREPRKKGKKMDEREICLGCPDVLCVYDRGKKFCSRLKKGRL